MTHVEMIIDYITDGTDFQYSDNHGILTRCRECKYWEREKPFATSGRCFIWECTERKGSDYCSEARKVSE